MKIRFENADELKANLNKAKKLINEIQMIGFKNKEFDEENLKKVKKIKEKILELNYINYNCMKIKIISSDGAELIKL